MRTTLNIDDELLMRAQNITNITSKPKLIREALKALVERESARQLAKLGGSQPGLRSIPRRRFKNDSG
ncbi:MAG: type II toxin-antitoxin system VapB family antitoxin [Candidatus Dadabacteria bacterium]|nr:type II toxin-antitoxin system VapB family antitoxin [Candidatus Dadabacteria bacterium]MYI73751.1 type II toxin-antitoxin system VapB family antitoxin [Candidatus Dadabacteria bacterium]